MQDKTQSISKLLLANQDSLRKFISSYNHDSDYVNDTLQDVNLLILEKSSLIPNESEEFIKYVLSVAMNVMRRNWNREKLRHPLGKAREPQYTRNFIGMDLSSLLNILPEESGMVLRLFLQGYKYEDIASMKKIPVGTVKSRIYYAKRKMQIMAS